MKRAISFSVFIGLFIVLSAMSSYIQLGQNNYSGSGSNQQTCKMCHGSNDDSLSISYWLPNGLCYTPGSTYDFGIQVRDSSEYATFAGVQLSTLNQGTGNSPAPVTLGILGSGNGLFQYTNINGIEIYSSENPHWLGWGITYPNQTQGYGTNIVRRYWTALNATDTIEHYICVVMTRPDTTMFNDRVICDVLKISPCIPLGFSDPIYTAMPQVENPWELYRSDFTMQGQFAPEGNGPMEVYIHKHNYRTKKVVKIH